ncbi:MAG: HAMP domain-containing sensor histidine kinase, partial [Zavarzinia sp.]|nr:HAMP domain-containing sensor histidine kinase [Zavarzinia sp.]
GDPGRLERLVRQMLAAARAEAGLYAGPDEQVMARDLAGDVVESMLPLALSLGVEIGIGGEGDFAIEGNRAALHGLLGNLVENALEHSPKGAAVDVLVEGAAGTIAVADQGAGIAPALRERIFERFWSGAKPQGRQGSGLGLVIAAAIARRHEAQLSVADRPGGGALFTIAWNRLAKDKT